MALPVTTGIHPVLITIPFIALLASSWNVSGPLPAAFFAALVVLAVLNFYLTKPKRLVLTTRRLLTCSATFTGGAGRIERSDPFGAVQVSAPRSGFPVGSMEIRYADTATTARIARLFFPTAAEFAARLPSAPITPPRPD